MPANGSKIEFGNTQIALAFTSFRRWGLGACVSGWVWVGRDLRLYEHGIVLEKHVLGDTKHVGDSQIALRAGCFFTSRCQCYLRVPKLYFATICWHMQAYASICLHLLAYACIC